MSALNKVDRWKLSQIDTIDCHGVHWVLQQALAQ